MSQNNNRYSNIIVIFTILLCTLGIIFTNYINNIYIKEQIISEIQQKEYQKIGWKDNYEILQAIQKEELIWYIDKLKSEQPEIIYNIRQKNSLHENLLSWEELSWFNISQDLPIAIMEFSDLECEACKRFYVQDIASILESSFSGSIGHHFIHFPLPQHQNSLNEAIASNCIQEIHGKLEERKFINHVFEASSSGWKWYNLNNISEYISQNNINSNLFTKCYTSSNSKKKLLDIFERGRKLGITQTPSLMIVNTRNWEYDIISWNDLNISIISESIKKIIH